MIPISLGFTLQVIQAPSQLRELVYIWDEN